MKVRMSGFLAGAVWFGLATTVFGAADSVENPSYHPKKTPSLTEPAVNTSEAAAQWDSISRSQPVLKCDLQEVWEAAPGSKITVTALKDKKVPVKASFDQVKVLLFLDKPSEAFAAGQGSVNLASYNSGVEARDRRVQKYVFQVEQPGMGISLFSLTFNPPVKIPKSGTTSGTAKVDIMLEGDHLKATMPIRVGLNPDSTVTLQTEKEAPLTFVTNSKSKLRVISMMKACNHHFIGKAVQVGVDLKLKNLCAAPASASPAPSK